jgi:4-hydroxy-2-oxoheptanedioate aldolase
VVQIESAAGLAAIEDIAAVEGVDGLFIGPGDLAGGLGHLGNSTHPDVVSAISEALTRIRAAGKAAGIFAASAEAASRHIRAGASFVSIGTDTGLLFNGASDLRKSVKL